MKLCLYCIVSLTTVNAFLAPTTLQGKHENRDIISELSQSSTNDAVTVNRKDFLVASTLSVVGVTTSLLSNVEPASARGRATLEKTYERYAPRIRAGTSFYANELRQMVAKDDFASIKLALQEPPSRVAGDLSKPDAGVAARAAAAGGFSDARVLVAADLFGAAFSESSITPKTKKLQKLVAEERDIINEMQSVAKQALGEESTGGGLFGLGAKKPSTPELSKRMKELYVKGGNVWNQYILAANDNLALQFDRFEYVK
jgi:hypothetical protein